jgi:hypothetical protein
VQSYDTCAARVRGTGWDLPHFAGMIPGSCRLVIAGKRVRTSLR